MFFFLLLLKSSVACQHESIENSKTIKNIFGSFGYQKENVTAKWCDENANTVYSSSKNRRIAVLWKVVH